MRIPTSDLPHRVTLEARKETPASRGSDFQAPRDNIPALVVSKVQLVRDERVDSPTRGAEITSSATVRMWLENYVPPGSMVTIHKGTPAERKAQVVAANYNSHHIAPESSKLFLE